MSIDAVTVTRTITAGWPPAHWQSIILAWSNGGYREGQGAWPPRSPCPVGRRVALGERTSASWSVSHKELNQRRRQENSSGGASFSLGADTAPPSPSFPSPPLPPFSLPLPYLSLPFPSPLVLSPPLRSRPPKIQLGGLGERCKLLQRGLGRSPSRQTYLVHFSLKI